jgi:cation:H+ antiporter
MMYFVASDLFMGRINSLAFLGCFVVYLVFVMTCERDRIIETVEVSDDLNPETPKDKLASDQSPKKLLLMTSVGLGILLAGSYMIVETGAGLARQIGISETLIGISLVAVGTSLPELAASIAAIRHKDTDIIMGNILGSNIFNILLVLGVAGLLHPFNIEHSIATYDILVMCLFTFALVPFMLKGRIGKGGGAFFLISYLIYIVLRFIADM